MQYKADWQEKNVPSSFMVFPSMNYQGPSSYGFRVNEVLRTDGRLDGRKGRNTWAKFGA